MTLSQMQSTSGIRTSGFGHFIGSVVFKLPPKNRVAQFNAFKPNAIEMQLKFWSFGLRVVSLLINWSRGLLGLEGFKISEYF